MSVITNIVRYSREFVITMSIYVAKWSIGAKNGNSFHSLYPWIRYNRDRYNRVWLYLAVFSLNFILDTSCCLFQEFKIWSEKYKTKTVFCFTRLSCWLICHLFALPIVLAFVVIVETESTYLKVHFIWRILFLTIFWDIFLKIFVE